MPDTGDRKGKSQDAETLFYRSDLLNTEFYRRNEKAILAACREGKILDDLSAKKFRMGQPFGKVSK
jgi:hypothetical protein